MPLFAFIAPTTEISKSVSFNLLNANPREVKLIGYFAIFKKAYPNGKIYHYKGCWKNRTERTGVSRNTFNRIISEFQARGWVEMAGKTICLVGKSKLAYGLSESKKVKYIELDMSKDLSDQLRYCLLNTKVTRIAYAKSQVALDKRVVKKLFKRNRAAFHEISSTTLGNTFGLSRSSGHRIAKRLKKKKMVRIRRGKKKLVGFCSLAMWKVKETWWNFKEDMKNCFFHRGAILFNPSCKFSTWEKQDSVKTSSSFLKTLLMQCQNLTVQN